MKKILIAILMCMPGIANAQNNTWEMSETEVAGKVINPDQKYLAGAYLVVNGIVQSYPALFKLVRLGCHLSHIFK